MKPLAPIVGANIKRLRKDHNFTQKDLSWHLNLLGLKWTQAQVSLAERGHMPAVTCVESLAVLATVLDASMAEFFEWPDDGNTQHSNFPRQWITDFVSGKGVNY